MKEQNYQNHVKLHPTFHFFGAPLILVALIGTIVNFVVAIWNNDHVGLATLILVSTILLGVTFLLTRLYTLKVQDRVIRMEENFRHHLLTGKLLDTRLTVKQIVALRFASDEEFAALAERVAKEGMAPQEIKQAIKSWKADYHRA